MKLENSGVKFHVQRQIGRDIKITDIILKRVRFIVRFQNHPPLYSRAYKIDTAIVSPLAG